MFCYSFGLQAGTFGFRVEKWWQTSFCFGAWHVSDSWHCFLLFFSSPSPLDPLQRGLELKIIIDGSWLPSKQTPSADPTPPIFHHFSQKLTDHFGLSLLEAPEVPERLKLEKSRHVDSGSQPMKAGLLELIFWACVELWCQWTCRISLVCLSTCAAWHFSLSFFEKKISFSFLHLDGNQSLAAGDGA